MKSFRACAKRLEAASADVRRKQSAPRPPRLRNCGGSSLVEVVVSTLLISVVLLGALEVVGSAARGVRIASTQADARLLAESMLAEVLAVSYEDPDASTAVAFGVETNESANPSTRVAFDDVDDYDGWLEQDGIASRDGLQQRLMPGWRRSVHVQHIAWDDPTSTKADGDDQDVKRIFVEVTDPEGNRTYCYAIRSASGAVEQPLGVDTDVTTAVSVAVEVDGEVLNAKAHLLNHAVGP
jgi:Tfp pilus assembly protein PilV